MSSDCCLPPLDLGTLYLNRTWGGCAWGVVDPATRTPVDLSSASAWLHLRPSKTARVITSPDTPALELASDDDEITFEDGDGELAEGMTFDTYMAARLPGDPLPLMSYPWIVAIAPRFMEDPPPGKYDGDVLLDPDSTGDNRQTIRHLTVEILQSVTRVEASTP